MLLLSLSLQLRPLLASSALTPFASSNDLANVISANGSGRPSVAVMAASASERIIQTRISVASSTRRLDLSNCGLDEVPPQIFMLRDLEELSLAWNNISYLPGDIENLKNLRHLGLSGNWLMGLPPNIGKLTELETLWVQGNLLQHLPIEVGNLKHLTILNVTGNMLEDILETVSSLSNLILLSLSGNKLKQLPSGLGDMSSLKILTTNGNFLQSLPMSIEKLSSLEKLSLQGNRLEHLPSNLAGLSSLKELIVADNELVGVPDSIGELKYLKSLSLYGNKISNLPLSLCKMKQLQSLWLEGNPLNNLPEAMLKASNLKALGIDSDMAHSVRSLSEPHGGLRISRLVGTGLVSSFGGYFKLQQSLEISAKVVVVAFGSAPGVPNWGGLLSRIRKAMLADNKKSAFDVLYVVDTRRSWYTETKLGEEWHHASLTASPGCPSGTAMREKECATVGGYFQQELQEALKDYKRVVMIGDSMGASAGLLFSPLATSVIAFCPQVDMIESAIRPGRGRDWFRSYKQSLINAVVESSAHITVHCGSWEHDKYQAQLLPKKVNVVVHNSESHRLARELDEQGTLLKIIRRRIEEEIDAAHGAQVSTVV
ncbi:hypothetical protein KP509_27G042400 [Ceratopteris richardii]|uniref:Uncharacterized protein n=2 Tax=Ceratopteris richardii TaxID=49495 RepID=A0A8T2RFQ0_CERRI|nr:hypothetical protein KP509_27G042400 [Ceratopteris richardii]